jgi:hypothetical protein
MAYHAWRMVEGLCILSDLTCQASEESGEKDQEESWIFGQQIRSTDDCVILCLAVKRHLAWTTYELYLLWHVLFYAHCDRESDRGTMQEAGGAIQA